MSVKSILIKIRGDSAEFNEAMAKMDKQMKETGKKMQDIGRSMSMYVTAPLVGLGAAAFNAQKNFESSMSKITGLVGVAADQVSEWSDELIKLGPQLGKAPAELADALFFVTSAGLRGAEAMNVLTVSAKASVAGLGETKTIADLVTSAMNAYGVETLSASDATDILVATVREGKGEASDYAQAMGQILPVSSEMKVSFNQVGAAMAAMTRTGTNAATAATQLTQIMMGLQKPSEQANDALDTMRTSAAELRKGIREDGLLATLVTLKDLTNEYGEEMMANVFPNIRAFKGVLDLMGASMDTNIGIQERMNDTTGETEKAFQVAADTAEHVYNKAMAQAQSTMIVLGDTMKIAIIPLLGQFTSALEKLSEWFKGLSPEMRKVTVGTAAFAAALGPVLIAIGTFMRMIPILRAGLISLRTAALGPLGLAIAGVFGVWKLWNNQILQTKKFTESLADKSLTDLEKQAEQTRVKIAELKKAKDELVEPAPDDDAGFWERHAARMQTAGPIAGGTGAVGGGTTGLNAARMSQLDLELKKLENQEKILNEQIEPLKEINKQEADRLAEEEKIKAEIKEQTDAMLNVVDGTQQAAAAVREMNEAATAPDGFAEWMDAITPKTKSVVDQLKETEDAINALWEPSLVFGEIDESIKQIDEDLGVIADPERFDELSEGFLMLADSARIFGDQVMRAGIQGASSMKEYGQMVKQIAKQNIAAFIAEGTAALIKNALTTSAKLGPVGLALAGGFAAAAGGIAAAAFNAIPGFATGGVVPPGYPNDTYLARLTSGETIVPKNQSMQGGTLTTRIAGQDLLFILNQAQDKNMNSY